MKWTYSESFAGIGAWGKAIKKVTKRHSDTYELKWYAELDKYASNAFSAIHNESEDKNIWDITKNVKVENTDIFFYSPPCQTFSLAGTKAGINDEKGNLFWEALQKIILTNPKYCIMENVKNLASQFKADMNNMIKSLNQAGYVSYAKVLNTKDYGIPQNRERIFIVSIRKDIYKPGMFEWPKKHKLELTLKDLLESDVDEKYYLSETAINGYLKNAEKQNKKGNGFKWQPTDGNGVAASILCNAGSRPCDNYIKVNQVGNIVDTDSFGGNPQRGRIYGNGLSPALNTVSGGGLEPKILVKSATKADEIAESGDSITHDQPSSKTRRGKVGNKVSQTLTTSCNVGILIGSKQANAAIKKNGVCTTLTTAMGAGGGQISMWLKNNKIRKLTPLECFRLQGFDDEDYYKAVKSYDSKFGLNKDGKTRSDSQMYKRAGNTITVNVIEEILENLLYGRKQDGQQISMF